MPAPNASYSITIRVDLDSDPRGIGRLTTAVGEADGTVTAVDVVESHHHGMVVDLTCNAQDADHAETIAKAIEPVEGAHVHKVSDHDKVSDHKLSFLHSAAKAACRRDWLSTGLAVDANATRGWQGTGPASSLEPSA